jgi:hypothetical protein
MRFALFTTNLAGGGAEKALAKIGSGLAGRGHEVDFIVCEDAETPCRQTRAARRLPLHALTARRPRLAGQAAPGLEAATAAGIAPP